MKAHILFRITAAVVILSPPTTAETIFGLNTTNRLYRFDSLAPGTLKNVNGGNQISGLPPNEFLLAIHFRPVATDSPAVALNGVLYALGPIFRDRNSLGSRLQSRLRPAPDCD